MNKKGMTLVEVIVTVAILGCVSATLYAFLNPMISQYGKAAETKVMSDLASGVLHFYEDAFRYTEETSFTYKEGYDKYYTNNKNELMVQQSGKSETVLFGNDYFMEYTPELTFSKYSNYSVKITIVLSKDGERKYEAATYVECVNLKLHGRQMEDKSAATFYTK